MQNNIRHGSRRELHHTSQSGEMAVNLQEVDKTQGYSSLPRAELRAQRMRSNFNVLVVTLFEVVAYD